MPLPTDQWRVRGSYEHLWLWKGSGDESVFTPAISPATTSCARDGTEGGDEESVSRVKVSRATPPQERQRHTLSGMT
eukprot:contig_27605_g6795